MFGDDYQALERRGKELSQLQQRTEQMAEHAEGFADVAAKLVEKYRK